LLTAGKKKSYYTETEGALRYVVAGNGEKGVTFAVEPVSFTHIRGKKKKKKIKKKLTLLLFFKKNFFN
ncbi:DUF1454 family protein, partial [Escherichia coli]|nr:DUF1454 family protein [Escherichia coli]